MSTKKIKIFTYDQACDYCIQHRLPEFQILKRGHKLYAIFMKTSNKWITG